MRGAEQKQRKIGRSPGSDDLVRGREAYVQRRWDDAYRLLSAGDAAGGVGAEDLERLALAAYLTGRDEVYLETLDRTHHLHLESGNRTAAARAAFWLGLRLAFRGEAGRATGWFGRAQRILQQQKKSCVEEGYLLLPLAEQQIRAGAAEEARATAERAAAIGDRFADADLIACACHLQGRALIGCGELERGLALLDEAMVAVTVGELSTMMAGLIYCSVVEACNQVCAIERAREWTAALADWCAAQPQLVTFTGTCLAHRAEILQLSGAWRDALEEAHRACAGLGGEPDRAAAAAHYQIAEVHRLQGRFGEAEQEYREANRKGREPLPGLALLRLAEGRSDAAASTIGRALGTTADPLERARLLPAYVDIMLAAGDPETARDGCRELNDTARRFPTAVLRAMAAQARGAVDLAAGGPAVALPALREAFHAWQRVGAPYPAARTRELIGLACRALGDGESAEMELSAATEAYAALGCAPDLARIRVPDPEANSHSTGLTPREVEVLRLVAAGHPNKAVAAQLALSERTIDRHLGNIFVKLDVSSRTAATAWAFRHKLV